MHACVQRFQEKEGSEAVLVASFLPCRPRRWRSYSDGGMSDLASLVSLASAADDDAQESTEDHEAPPAAAAMPPASVVIDPSRGNVLVEPQPSLQPESEQPLRPPVKLQPLARLFGSPSTAALPKAAISANGRAASQLASSRLIKLLQQVREARLFRVRSFADPVASRIFNVALPGLVQTVGSDNDVPLDERQHALAELAIGLASVTRDEAAHALERLEITGAVLALSRLGTKILDATMSDRGPTDANASPRARIYSSRVRARRRNRASASARRQTNPTGDAAAADEVDALLCHVMVVIANVAWNGGVRLIVSTGCVPLLLRALATDVGAEHEAAACAALYNVATDPDGATVVHDSALRCDDPLYDTIKASLSGLTVYPSFRLHARTVLRCIRKGSGRPVLQLDHEQKERQQQALMSIQQLAKSREVRESPKCPVALLPLTHPPPLFPGERGSSTAECHANATRCQARRGGA